jgi:hypothetical protein
MDDEKTRPGGGGLQGQVLDYGAKLGDQLDASEEGKRNSVLP